MKNLLYKAVENSKNTSGESGNHPNGGSGQLSRALKVQQATIAANMGCTHFGHHLYMDTDAQMQANYLAYAANYNLNTLETETQEWFDVLHAAGLKVISRGSWSGVKGNNNFAFVKYGTGGFIPLGTVAGAASEGETTYCGKLYRWMDVNVGASRWEDGDIIAPISECTEYLSNANYTFFDTSGGTQQGLYTFFQTLKDVVDAYALAIGKDLKFYTIINYSEYASGYLDATLPNDTGFIAIDYYGHAGGYSSGQRANPSAYVEDWTTVKTQVGGTGKLFQTEMGGIFGDSWPTIGNTPATQSPRVNSLEESAKYQINFYTAYRDSLVDPGLMVGISNWGFWSGQNSSILGYSNGTYYLNYFGQIFMNFIKGDGMARIPVFQSGSFTSDSWGGRAAYF